MIVHTTAAIFSEAAGAFSMPEAIAAAAAASWPVGPPPEVRSHCWMSTWIGFVSRPGV